MSYLYFILYIIIGCVCAWLVHSIKSLIRFCKLIEEFPGNKPSFILGNLTEFSKDAGMIFQQLIERSVKYPGGYRNWGGWYIAYVFIKATDYEVILSNMKYLNKEYIYSFFYPWLSTGLLTSTGDKWHVRRKILTPAFHFNILRKFVKHFDYQIEQFRKILENECEKDKTDVEPLMSALTLNIICETVMGVRLDEENATERKSYINAVHGAGDILMQRIYNVAYYFDSIFWLMPKGRQFYKHVKTMHKFCDRIIEEREKNFKDSDVLISEKDEDEEEADLYKKKKRFAMLDLLISAKRTTGEIDDAGIREEVNTFIFEGHDTTSSALSFITFCLANYKDVQEKVREEVDNVCGGSNRRFDYHDLQKMTYLDMVIKEVLRVYPAVPLFTRTLWDEVPLRNGKYTMPKSSVAAFFTYMLHRDPQVFEDPERFDPERFSPENCKNRNPYAYVPFSAGPRNCIGQKFAILELKSVVSQIVRHFEIDPIDKPGTLLFKTHLVLRTVNGLHVKFRKRSDSNNNNQRDYINCN